MKTACQRCSGLDSWEANRKIFLRKLVKGILKDRLHELVRWVLLLEVGVELDQVQVSVAILV
jgi:hypothetical protein